MFSSYIKTPTHVSEQPGLRRSFFGSQGNIYNPTSPKINLPSPKNMNSQRMQRTNILETILGNPAKKLVGSPVAAAAASKKLFKRIGSQDESQIKIAKHNNSGSFRGLSPVPPKGVMSNSHQLPIKKDKIGRKLIGNEKAERQDSELNFSVPIKEEDKSSHGPGLLEGLSKIESKGIEKELQKKELIIKIYEEILSLAKHHRKSMKTLQETSADIYESSITDTNDIKEETKKASGDKPRLSDNRSIGNLKGRKDKVRGLSVVGASNSSYSMQQQKSTQRTLNKTSYDSKMTIKALDAGVNSTEESGCLTPLFYNKPIIKKIGDAQSATVVGHQRPKSGIVQYRIRKGVAGHEDERSSGLSGSLSPSRKDRRNEPMILIKEGNYKNRRSSQDVDKSQIKKETFVDFGSRLDSVFTTYNKKNEQLMKEIEEMVKKIAIIKASKKQ